MINTILKIKAISVFRALQTLPVVHFLVLVVIVALLLFSLFEVTRTTAGSTLVCLATILILPALHLSRKDKAFIEMVMLKPELVYIREYVLLTMPLIVIFLLHSAYYQVLLLLAGIALTSFIKKKKSQGHKSVSLDGRVPFSLFEYYFVIRSSGIPLAILFLAAMGLSFIPYISLVLIWMMLTFLITPFLYCEPVEMLQVHTLGAIEFVHDKLKKHLAVIIMIVSPALLLSLFFQPQYWYVYLYLLFACMLFVAFCILIKYSLYAPGKKAGASQLFISFALISILIPVFLPVIFLMEIRYYFKAISNMKNYLG